jgi:Fic family protein
MSDHPAINPRPPHQLFRNTEEKRALEVRNGLRQYDEVLRLVQAANGVLNITPDLLKHLQRIAIQDIYTCAGEFRNGPVIISNCLHQPPPHDHVGPLVDDMCQYANGSTDKTPLHTAAYLLWRMNWIHPFSGGNGRTARALSYMALCIRLGCILPGSNTIPAQIVANRGPYYCALHYADALFEVGMLNVTAMEQVLAKMLHDQLGSVFASALVIPTAPCPDYVI